MTFTIKSENEIVLMIRCDVDTFAIRYFSGVLVYSSVNLMDMLKRNQNILCMFSKKYILRNEYILLLCH